MIYNDRTYSALVVSSSQKFSDSLKPMLQVANCRTITNVSSISSAKRSFQEHKFDYVVINTPLPDDFGTKFAIDVCNETRTVCLLIVSGDRYDEIRTKTVMHGVFVLPKPMSPVSMSRSLDFMASCRERLRSLEKKTVSIQEKMEEIRLVNKAKWLLIENLNMTEPDAHRHIEKQAMDTCSPKKDVALEIIKVYS